MGNSATSADQLKPHSLPWSRTPPHQVQATSSLGHGVGFQAHSLRVGEGIRVRSGQGGGAISKDRPGLRGALVWEALWPSVAFWGCWASGGRDEGRANGIPWGLGREGGG